MPCSPAALTSSSGPERSLYLADVGFSQVEHTDTGLADSAADRVGKLFIQDGFLEGKLRPLRQPARSNCFFREFSSTRIPMEESSRAMSSTG